MNVWLVASLVLIVALVPCFVVAARSDLGSALAALNVASVLVVTILVTMTVGFERPPFISLAIVLGPMAMIGSFAFLRFLERRR